MTESPRGPLFGELFFGLRDAGVKVGLTEWMALMEALAKGAIAPSLDELYPIARALLVKNEAHFDAYDQVFKAVFSGGEFPKLELEKLLDWLSDPLERLGLTAEELKALPLEKLRELFEKRLQEQTERHDGGNFWIGTGGQSPFGNGGQNPGGVRASGGGGGKSAVQLAEARRYRDYRNDRVLDTRALAVALKKLRRLSRVDGEPELDVDESIDKTCRNAGELELVFRPPRKNEAKVALLMDTGGSMDPYTRLVEQLFSAASHLNSWKKFEAFFFHNCVYETVYSNFTTGQGIPTAEFIANRLKDTFLIMVGDADMAPSELLSRFGALYYFHQNNTPGVGWLHRLRSHFTRAVWLNPLPPKYWQNSTTVRIIGQLFPMYQLTVDGLEQAVDRLLRRAPDPLPEIESLLGPR